MLTILWTTPRLVERRRRSRPADFRRNGDADTRGELTWIPPMLATLTGQLPTGGKWVYEPKLDGVRALIYVSGGSVQHLLPQPKAAQHAYPELVEALSETVQGRCGARWRDRGLRPGAWHHQLRATAAAHAAAGSGAGPAKPGSGAPVSLRLHVLRGDRSHRPAAAGAKVGPQGRQSSTTDPIRFTPFQDTGPRRCSRRPAPSKRRASSPSGRIRDT